MKHWDRKNNIRIVISKKLIVSRETCDIISFREKGG